mmetsp:Transcript_107578/g.213699  ORF Transcript_107578/g.213699 Transcript_107578/m.213699 type:complete len:276 (+) Transcript_107578:1089-1916(+)
MLADFAQAVAVPGEPCLCDIFSKIEAKKPPLLQVCGKKRLQCLEASSQTRAKSEPGAGAKRDGWRWLRSSGGTSSSFAQHMVPSSGCGTNHVFSPGCPFKPCSGGGGRRRTATPYRIRVAATTASSSMGLKLHVLYTSRPPGRSISRPRQRMVNCRWWRSSASFGLHLSHNAGCFLRVPSPEQGTSAKTRSNKRDWPSCVTRFGKKRASTCVTMVVGEPNLFKLCFNVSARFASISLATTAPVGASLPPSQCIISMICEAFEPGDAHRSSTICPG